MDDDRDPPDRAAILARRQRFIALAVGVAGVAACHRPGPQPCLSPPYNPPPNDTAQPNDTAEPDGATGPDGATEPDAATGADTPAEPGPTTDAPPGDVTPQPCLRVRAPSAP